MLMEPYVPLFPRANGQELYANSVPAGLGSLSNARIHVLDRN